MTSFLRRRVPIAILCILLAISLLSVAFLTHRPVSQTKAKGTFRLTVWHPPDSSDFDIASSAAVDSAVPSHFALADSMVDKQPYRNLRIYALQGSSLKETKVITVEPKPTVDARFCWPDGKLLKMYTFWEGKDGTRQLLLMWDNVSNKKPDRFEYMVPSAFGPVVRGEEFWFLQRSPRALLRCQGAKVSKIVVPMVDPASIGYAWDRGERTFAAVRPDGAVFILNGSDLQFTERPELHRLGLAMASAKPRVFFLAKDFACMTDMKTGIDLIPADGKIVHLNTRDPFLESPSGRKRNQQFLSIQRSILKKLHPSENSSTPLRQLFWAEGASAPADVCSKFHTIRLLSEDTVGIFDWDYRRVILVQLAPQPRPH